MVNAQKGDKSKPPQYQGCPEGEININIGRRLMVRLPPLAEQRTSEHPGSRSGGMASMPPETDSLAKGHVSSNVINQTREIPP